jgi:hypothetical protein
VLSPGACLTLSLHIDAECAENKNNNGQEKPEKSKERPNDKNEAIRNRQSMGDAIMASLAGGSVNQQSQNYMFAKS